MTGQKTLLILNGPGLSSMDGVDQQKYGDFSLDDVRRECNALCESLEINTDFRQSDDQEELCRWITNDSENVDGVIINPVGSGAADSLNVERYRSAIRKLAHLKRPVIEVHVSNIYSSNTEITHPLHESEGDLGFICGMGRRGYLMAIKALAHRFSQPRPA